MSDDRVDNKGLPVLGTISLSTFDDRVDNQGQIANKIERNDKQLKKWEAIIRGQDKRLEGLLNTAFQLANYYFVFQGAILAGVSNRKHIACDNRWIVFTLSAIVTFLNLGAFTVTGFKYKDGLRQRFETWCRYNTLVTEQNLLRSQQPPRTETNFPLRDLDSEMKHWVMFASCVIMLGAFAAVTLTGCWMIGCHHHEEDDKDTNTAPTCIQICDAFKCMKLCNYYE